MTQMPPQHVIRVRKKGPGCLGGCLIVIGVIVALFIGAPIIMAFLEHQEEQRQQQVRDATDSELRVFAEDHLPNLQRVIYDIQGEIDRRTELNNRLAEDIRRLGREPYSDDDWSRWDNAINAMQQQLADLKDKRIDAFLAYRKFELNPDSADDARAREERFRIAQQAADEGRATFEQLLRDATRNGH